MPLTFDELLALVPLKKCLMVDVEDKAAARPQDAPEQHGAGLNAERLARYRSTIRSSSPVIGLGSTLPKIQSLAK